MASKYFFYSLILQGFLAAVIFLLIHHHPQASPKESNTPQHVSANSSIALSDWDQLFSGFKPRPDSHRVVIPVDQITKALWDSGFKIMSLILDRNLRSLIPYADSDSDTDKKNNNTITLYNGSKITIFAPSDRVISFKAFFRTHYRYHIVPMKVEREDFSECSIMPSLDPHGADLIITTVHRVHTTRVTHWNIYNDNNVIVHGVAGNFLPLALYPEILVAYCYKKELRPLLSGTE